MTADCRIPIAGAVAMQGRPNPAERSRGGIRQNVAQRFVSVLLAEPVLLAQVLAVDGDVRHELARSKGQRAKG